MSTVEINCTGPNVRSKCREYDRLAGATGDRPKLLQWEGSPPTVEEAQKVVGGFISLLELSNGAQLLFDEEAAIKSGVRANPDACTLLLETDPGLFARFGGAPILGTCLVLKEGSRWK